MKAIITKSCKGQPTGTIEISGKPSDVLERVRHYISFYPFWNCSVKWVFDKERAYNGIENVRTFKEDIISHIKDTLDRLEDDCIYAHILSEDGLGKITKASEKIIKLIKGVR